MKIASTLSTHGIMTKTAASHSAHAALKVVARNALVRNPATDATAIKPASRAIARPSLNSTAKVLKVDLTVKPVTGKNHFAVKPAVNRVANQADAAAVNQVGGPVANRVESQLIVVMTGPMPDAKLTSDRHQGHQS